MNSIETEDVFNNKRNVSLSGKRNTGLVAIVASITSVLLVLSFCICYLRHKKLKSKGICYLVEVGKEGMIYVGS